MSGKNKIDIVFGEKQCSGKIRVSPNRRFTDFTDSATSDKVKALCKLSWKLM